MITYWTFFDFTIQWIWVGIIVALAAVYFIGTLRRSLRRPKGGNSVNCAGCVLADKCNHDADKCCEEKGSDSATCH